MLTWQAEVVGKHPLTKVSNIVGKIHKKTNHVANSKTRAPLIHQEQIDACFEAKKQAVTPVVFCWAGFLWCWRIFGQTHPWRQNNEPACPVGPTEPQELPIIGMASDSRLVGRSLPSASGHFPQLQVVPANILESPNMNKEEKRLLALVTGAQGLCTWLKLIHRIDEDALRCRLWLIASCVPVFVTRPLAKWNNYKMLAAGCWAGSSAAVNGSQAGNQLLCELTAIAWALWPSHPARLRTFRTRISPFWQNFLKWWVTRKTRICRFILRNRQPQRFGTLLWNWGVSAKTAAIVNFCLVFVLRETTWISGFHHDLWLLLMSKFKVFDSGFWFNRFWFTGLSTQSGQ